MIQFLKKLFGSEKGIERGPSLPLHLLRRGWRPHRFQDSNVVVILPEEFVADFDDEGVLVGTNDGKEVEFSATLHGGFKKDRAGALDFVTTLAEEKKLKTRDVGTYRYFFDPTDEDPNEVANRFWVVGVPGAVVVISVLGTRESAASEVLGKIRTEIPNIVGELL